METAGERIKKARLEKGISLEEAHKKTKIHLDILKALEQDSLINFNPIYIKGFLKIYCKFLGIDPKDYITDYKAPGAKLEPKSVTGQRPVSAFKTVSLKLQPFKAVDIEIIKKVSVSILVLIFIAFFFRLGKIVSGKFTLFRSRPRSSVVTQPKIEKKDELVKAHKVQQSGAAIGMRSEGHAQALLKASSVSGVRLTIRARDNCWLKLKTDGKVIFQGNLMKGRSETWQAKDKIELFVSNAGAIELQANDKFYSNLGKKGQVIRNIVITKDGLAIAR